MLKFRCTHCGGRLAIQEKHLSRLTTCPDCGQITHPMAGQILAQRQRKNRLECDNCTRPLGRLARPRKWADATVCGACFRELAFEQMEQDQVEAQQAAYLEAAGRGVLVAAGPAKRAAAEKVTLLSLPYMARLPSPATAAISLDSANPDNVRRGLKGVIAGALIAFAMLVALTYLLRLAGYLLLGSAIVLAVAGAANWFWRRWPSGHHQKSDERSAATGKMSGVMATAVRAGAAGIWQAARWLAGANRW